VKESFELDKKVSDIGMDLEKIVQYMTSKDVDRIRKAGAEIIKNSQNETQIQKLFPYRDDIFEKTKNLDLGGAFATNNRFYQFPLEIIDYHFVLKSQEENKERCTCDLYLKSYHDYDPNEEALNDSMTLFAKGIGDYTFVYGMKCEKCKRRFHISERHYHYIWYKWDILTKDIKAPNLSSDIDKVFKLYLDIVYTALSEKSQKSDLKFHKENLSYYRNRLLQAESTKDYETQNNWTELLNKALNDIA
jgi:hypothetical protein